MHQVQDMLQMQRHGASFRAQGLFSHAVKQTGMG
jgi:hypothetical protein